jgi:dihydrofolate reductase
MSARRVRVQCSISIDGYSSGPGGPGTDTWLYEHAVRESSATYFAGIWSGCSTALMGRNNYEGFHAVWPGITADPAIDDRTRALGEWLGTVEKAVVSTTLTDADATWENSRVFARPADAVRTLRSEPGRDVLVLQSQQVVAALLAEDLVDDLHLTVVPVLLGGGLRLLPEGTATTGWTTASSTTLEAGAVAVHWRRAR